MQRYSDREPETGNRMAETGVSAMAESRRMEKSRGTLPVFATAKWILPAFSAEKQSHREAMGKLI